MDGGPPSSRPPSAFFCPPHSAWQLIAHSYALLDSQMANTRIERSKAKQRLEGRAIALAFRRPTAERLSGRRADCCGEFGSLSLKGGGQEGVVAAASRSAGFPCCPSTIATKQGESIKFEGPSMRHPPPPVLPLSGGGTRRHRGGLICDGCAARRWAANRICGCAGSRSANAPRFTLANRSAAKAGISRR